MKLERGSAQVGVSADFGGQRALADFDDEDDSKQAARTLSSTLIRNRHGVQLKMARPPGSQLRARYLSRSLLRRRYASTGMATAGGGGTGVSRRRSVSLVGSAQAGGPTNQAPVSATGALRQPSNLAARFRDTMRLNAAAAGFRANGGLTNLALDERFAGLGLDRIPGGAPQLGGLGPGSRPGLLGGALGPDALRAQLGFRTGVPSAGGGGLLGNRSKVGMDPLLASGPSSSKKESLADALPSALQAVGFDAQGEALMKAIARARLGLTRNSRGGAKGGGENAPAKSDAELRQDLDKTSKRLQKAQIADVDGELKEGEQQNVDDVLEALIARGLDETAGVKEGKEKGTPDKGGPGSQPETGPTEDHPETGSTEGQSQADTTGEQSAAPKSDQPKADPEKVTPTPEGEAPIHPEARAKVAAFLAGVHFNLHGPGTTPMGTLVDPGAENIAGSGSAAQQLGAGGNLDVTPYVHTTGDENEGGGSNTIVGAGQVFGSLVDPGREPEGGQEPA